MNRSGRGCKVRCQPLVPTMTPPTAPQRRRPGPQTSGNATSAPPPPKTDPSSRPPLNRPHTRGTVLEAQLTAVHIAAGEVELIERSPAGPRENLGIGTTSPQRLHTCPTWLSTASATDQPKRSQRGDNPTGVLDLGVADLHAAPDPAGHPVGAGVYQRRRPGLPAVNSRPISNQTWEEIRTEFTLPALEQVRCRLAELMEDPEPVMRQLVRVFLSGLNRLC